MNKAKGLSRLRRVMGAMVAAFAAMATGVAQATILPGEPLGEEFQVNLQDDGAQMLPAIAADAVGNFSVVWQSHNGYGSEIHLRRYAPSGEPLTGEVLVSPQFGLMQEPAVAVDSNGVSLVVWHGSEYGLPADVYAQRVDAAGNLLGPTITVNQFTNGDQFQADVAIGLDGRAMVVWTSMGQDGNGAGVYARRFDSSGNPVGDEFQVNQYSEGEQLDPAVAMFGYDQAIIVWSGPSAGHEFTDIHARRYYNGAPIENEYRFNFTRDSHMGVPDVGADRYGHYYVVWHSGAGVAEGNGILMNWHNATSSSDQWRPDIVVSEDAAGVRRRPAVAVDAGAPDYFSDPATTLVTWEEINGEAGSDIYLMRYAGYYPIETAIRVTEHVPSDQDASVVAMDPPGNILIAWQSMGQDGDDQGVYGQRYAGPDMADLVLTIQASSPTTDMGDYLSYDLSISNEQVEVPYGASAPAGNVVMEITLPEGAELISTYGHPWICEGTGPLQCWREEVLDPHESDYFSITLMAPAVAGPATLHASVSTSTREENLLNNLAAATVSIGDYDPEPLTFAQNTDVARGSTQTSNAIVIQGNTMASPISVDGGLYSIDGGPFTSEPGTIQSGQAVRVQHVASSEFSGGRQTVLRVANVYGWFQSVTESRDATPDGFYFVDQTNVPRSSPRTSNAVTVSGVNDTVTVSVSGGSYSIDGGAYTSASGTVSAGQSITVRHTSASGFAATTNTVLTVGGVSDTFSSTTEAADTTPDAFGFGAQQDVQPFSARTSNAVVISGINAAAPISVSGGQYSINNGSFTSTAGTVMAGQSIRVAHTAGSFGGSVTTTLTVGGVAGSFTSTAIARDNTPDAFVFVDQAGVARGSQRTSNAVTITGINDAVAISVSGGSYAIDGGAYTSAAGTISAGQTVTLRHTASASFATAVDTVLTVGTRSDTFTSTTESLDGTPDAFSFSDQTAVPTGNLRTSNAVTVAGINDAVAISVTGGSYSINNGAFTSVAGTVQAGDQVRVQHTSAAAASTTVNTALTIGGVSDTFSSTTGTSDTTPNAFSFTDVTGAKRNTVTTSGAVTIGGINAAVPIAVSGGNATWSKNGVTYQSGAGTVSNGDNVRIRVTSSGSINTPGNVTVTIGGVTDVWTVTTGNK